MSTAPSPLSLLCASADVCCRLPLCVCVLAEVSEYASNLKAIVHYFRHTFAPPPPLLLLTPPPVIEVTTPPARPPNIHTHTYTPVHVSLSFSPSALGVCPCVW